MEVLKLAKNANPDKYKYPGYGIAFGLRESFAFSNVFGKNVIIFGANMSSFANVDKRKKEIVILTKGLGQELDDTTGLYRYVYNFYIFLFIIYIYILSIMILLMLLIFQILINMG